LKVDKAILSKEKTHEVLTDIIRSKCIAQQTVSAMVQKMIIEKSQFPRTHAMECQKHLDII
jgi:hypothetical protein